MTQDKNENSTSKSNIKYNRSGKHEKKTNSDESGLEVKTLKNNPIGLFSMIFDSSV